MIITKQIVMNLVEAIVTVGDDMTPEQQEAIDFDVLKSNQALPISQSDAEQGLHRPTHDEIALTLAELLLTFNATIPETPDS
jgi:hypothetical protein